MVVPEGPCVKLVEVIVVTSSVHGVGLDNEFHDYRHITHPVQHCEQEDCHSGFVPRLSERSLGSFPSSSLVEENSKH